LSRAKFDELIHAPTRLAVVSLLAAAGYVEIRKAFVGKRPRTSARLSKAGRTAFRIHVAALQQIIERSGSATALTANTTSHAGAAPFR